MEIKVKPGKYVLAVSGGVDSMVLLDLLANKPGIKPVVAHFNHGIREAADSDEEFVRQTATSLGLDFESKRVDLGKNASEEAARQARYDFLYHVEEKLQADAIITAHHQDDLIETAFINLLRGTGRKGLISIQNNPKIVRPLLGYRKSDILRYARERQLKWREDATNRDDSYLRNYIRLYVAKNLSVNQRREVLENVEKVAKLDKNIDLLIANLSQYISNNYEINRSYFSLLPVDLGEELVVFWLRQNQVRQFDKRTIGRLSTALKTAGAGTVHPVQGDIKLLVGRETARFA